eukprot:6213023-Pleurochrysis_carterae.AAC.2
MHAQELPWLVLPLRAPRNNPLQISPAWRSAPPPRRFAAAADKLMPCATVVKFVEVYAALFLRPQIQRQPHALQVVADLAARVSPARTWGTTNLQRIKQSCNAACKHSSHAE